MYPKLKYHCYAQQNITNTTYKLDEILPHKIKFRNNEVLQIDPKENLLTGTESLRQTYDKLIIASGLEPDYSDVPGLLYSLQDDSDPIFTSYEYETVIPKFCIYSAALINRIKHDYGKNLSKRNLNFLENGDGNIVFANVSSDFYDILENMQMIILLYDFILKYRKKEFLDKLNFIICLPVSKINFSLNNKHISTYFIDCLNERNIKINWNYELKEVNQNNILKFKVGDVNDQKNLSSSKKTSKDVKNYLDVEYNFAFVIPTLALPSYVRYSPLFSQDNKIDFDNEKLKMNNYKNIFLLGDSLKGNFFLDRFYTNILTQSHIISNNLKEEHFRLGKSYLKDYIPKNKIFFDFLANYYLLFDTSNGDQELMKKNIWNNFLFKHFYFRPEGFYSQRLLLKKKFGFTRF